MSCEAPCSIVQIFTSFRDKSSIVEAPPLGWTPMELQGLNFCPGLGVQAAINSKFGCSVSSDVSSGAFFLVASFGRCKFKFF